MALIEYSQYFDFEGLKTAIADLETRNKQFGSITQDAFKNIKLSIDSTTKSLRDNLNTLQNFNVNQKNAVQSIAAIGKNNDDLIAKQQKLTAAQNKAIELNTVLAQTQTSLNTVIVQAQKEIASLSDKEERDIEIKNSLVAGLNALTEAILNFNNISSKSLVYFDTLQQHSTSAVASSKELTTQFVTEEKEITQTAEAANVLATSIERVNNISKESSVNVIKPSVNTAPVTENAGVSVQQPLQTQVTETTVATEKQISALQLLNAEYKQLQLNTKNAILEFGEESDEAIIASISENSLKIKIDELSASYKNLIAEKKELNAIPNNNAVSVIQPSVAGASATTEANGISVTDIERKTVTLKELDAEYKVLQQDTKNAILTYGEESIQAKVAGDAETALKDRIDALSASYKNLIESKKEANAIPFSSSIKTVEDERAALLEFNLVSKDLALARKNYKDIGDDFGYDSEQAKEAAVSVQILTEKLNSLAPAVAKNTSLSIKENIDTSANTNGSIVTEQETAATQQQLEVTTALNAEKQQTLTIDKEESTAIAETTTFLDAYLGSLRQNLELQIENDVAISKNKTSQKELLAEMAASKTVTQQQTDKLIQLRTEQLGLNTTSKELKSNISLLSKEFISADGSIDEMRVRLNGLTSTYEALSVAEKQSAFGAQIKQQIDIMQPALQSAEGELGKFQRNVGNYSNSIVTSFKSAFGFIRQLAYIIPGIGMAGIFNLIFQAISKATTSLGLFGSSTEDTAKKVKSADEVIKEQADDMDKFKESLNGVQASALATGLKLQAFVDIAKDSGQPLKVQNDALIEANKILGEHGEKLTLVNIATAAVTDEVNKFTTALIQQAIAAKYADQIADLTIKKTNQTKDYNKAVADLNGAIAYNTKLVKAQGLANVSPFDLANVDAYTDKIKGAASVLNNTTGQIESIQGDFNEATQESISLFGELGTKGKDGVDKLKKSLQDAYEIQKEFLQDQINDEKSIANDTNVLYTLRAEAAQNASDLEIQLSQLTFEYDQKTKKNELLAEEQNALRIKQINLQLNNDLQKIFADRNKFAQPETITAPESEESVHAKELADQEKFNAELIKKIQEGGKARQITNSVNEQADLQANEDLYAAGLLSREKYEQAKIDIAKKYQLIDLNIQLSAQLSILTNQKQYSDAYEETLDNILKLENKIQELGNVSADTSKDLAKTFAALYENINALSNIAGNNVADVFSSLTKHIQDATLGSKEHLRDFADTAIAIGYSVADELNQADETRIANLEKNKARELQLAQNNAAAQQAINDRYAKEEAKIKRKEAATNKIAALFNIAINTAVATTKTLGETGFLGIPLLPIIIALGAAEAAVVLAQPLPQYEHGTTHAPEGFAVVDEKGTELIVDRYGNLKEIGADEGARITYLNEGDKVYTATQTKEIFNKYSENKDVQKNSFLKEISTSDISQAASEKNEERNIIREINLTQRLSEKITEGRRTEAIYNMSEALKTSGSMHQTLTHEIVKAIKDIPVFQTIFDEAGIREREKRRNDFITHRNTYNFSFKKNKN